MDPMDLAMRLLKDDIDEFMAQRLSYQERVEAAKEKAREAMQERENSVPCPTCGAQIGEQCRGLNPNLGYPSHKARMSLIQRGEPMDLAMRLLKSPLDLLSADELFELSALGTDDPELVERHLGEYRTLTPEEAEDISFRAVDAQITEGDASHPEGMSHEENVKQFRGRGGRPVNWGFNVGTRFGRGDEEGETHWEKSPPTIGPPPVNEPIFIPPGPKSPEIIANLAWPMGFTTENKGEPMDLAWRLLKDRKSPEAFRHKKEYDTKYESSPERVKYREELNRERRRRGMYGDHSGRDISHTEGGKLTVESEHANRARHFKDRGTLRPTTSQ